MSAQPLTEGSVPDWPVPPPGGYTAGDLDRLPGLPNHTELIDGSLVFVSPQAAFHSLTVDLLTEGLRRTVPDGLVVRREMSVILDRWQRPEPDVSVLRGNPPDSPERTSYAGSDVVLAVEVVSPDSQVRDRERKPQLYARAGILHFWRVENDDGRPVVHAFELDPVVGGYGLVAIHHDRLVTSQPFAIDIDLTAVNRL